MSKIIAPEKIISSLENLSIEDLITIAKKTAELISKQEKEAEQKLNLIRNGK